ncbi:hypothetical protein MGSAQ_002903 [marine sediment metagenome]|uniref:Uncharacterized protein n=1 Tax=marine sediment metagenome TaxID=412755 RepID=A0A1B6NRQ5_9ZZZZ
MSLCPFQGFSPMRLGPCSPALIPCQTVRLAQWRVVGCPFCPKLIYCCFR